MNGDWPVSLMARWGEEAPNRIPDKVYSIHCALAAVSGHRRDPASGWNPVRQRPARPGTASGVALEIARSVVGNSPVAVSRTQEAIWSSLETGYAQALVYAWSLIRVQWGHPDAAPRAQRRTLQ